MASSDTTPATGTTISTGSTGSTGSGAHPIGDETLRPRQSDRLTINKEFESFDAFIHEYVTNISNSGVFIKSKTPLAIGTKVTLRFTLIMDDIETIEGTGEVVRVEAEPAGMGILFTELTDESRVLIERLVASRSAAAAE